MYNHRVHCGDKKRCDTCTHTNTHSYTEPYLQSPSSFSHTCKHYVCTHLHTHTILSHTYTHHLLSYTHIHTQNHTHDTLSVGNLWPLLIDNRKKPLVTCWYMYPPLITCMSPDTPQSKHLTTLITIGTSTITWHPSIKSDILANMLVQASTSDIHQSKNDTLANRKKTVDASTITWQPSIKSDTLANMLIQAGIVKLYIATIFLRPHPIHPNIYWMQYHYSS